MTAVNKPFMSGFSYIFLGVINPIYQPFTLVH